jgi:hypothetical protein
LGIGHVAIEARVMAQGKPIAIIAKSVDKRTRWLLGSSR